MTYSISDLSKKFDLPASTIRYYEKIGLLENVEHANSYRRVYNDSHIDRLNAIECFKKALTFLNSSVMHLPIPFAPPVTTTTLSFNSDILPSLSFCQRFPHNSVPMVRYPCRTRSSIQNSLVPTTS